MAYAPIRQMPKAPQRQTFVAKERITKSNRDFKQKLVNRDLCLRGMLVLTMLHSVVRGSGSYILRTLFLIVWCKHSHASHLNTQCI